MKIEFNADNLPIAFCFLLFGIVCIILSKTFKDNQ